MRYFAVPSREQYEAKFIPQYFGKAYQPWGAVTIGTNNLLDRGGTILVDVHGKLLAIHPDKGTWAFLEKQEAEIFQRLNRVTFGSLSAELPNIGDFVTHLYRRGLITINGESAIDPTIFHDSPNTKEGQLVELLLTERCNLGCTYCLAGTNRKMPIMTPEIACRTIDLAFAMEEAASIGFEFSGGEPFLKYSLMKDLVEYIHNHPMRKNRRVYLSVQTNGTLLNDERVLWLKENQIQVGLSLDGQPWSQNISRPQINGGESFPKLIDGIDLLQRYQIPFGALVVLNQSNVGSVLDLIDFLLENGIHSFKLNPVAYLGTARTNWNSVGLTSNQVINYFTGFVDLITEQGYKLLEANLHTMLQFLTSKQRATRCLRSHCGAGDTFQAISAAGDIYPCGRSTQSPQLKLGNVLSPDIPSLSFPARNNRYIIEIRERRPTNLEGCMTCEYRQFCQAGCSVQAFEQYGTVRHRTPECDFYKTLYPYLMYKFTFDRYAFDTFNRVGYFDGHGVLIEYDFSNLS